MKRTAAAVTTLVLLAAACSADDSVDGTSSGPVDGTQTAQTCDWPMWGQNPSRTFDYPCETDLSPESVGDLEQAWYFTTEDVVTATPAVVDGTVYTGDWSGNVYAVDQDSGKEVWRYRAADHPTVYSGQITTSPAVADVGDDRTVFVGAGKTMYALDAETGQERWSHELGTPGDGTEPTEIQSSPVVIDDTVLFGFDAHGRPGFRAGVLALDTADGEVIWDFDPDRGEEPSGCAGVWSSPSVDTERGLVFVGTANCPSSPDGWSAFSEAIIALDQTTGEPVWTYQPHEPNRDDLDFAGAPNLFEVDSGVEREGGERAVVGLGNKDGAYYIVDRESGELISKTQVVEPEYESGSNFSFGGFIGPTAYAMGIVAGGTAGQGPTACPCLHGIDVQTGEVIWQAQEAQPIYGGSAIANGVVFSGGTDFVFRAVDLGSGEELWSKDMPGVVAGGSAVVGNDVIAVVGIREPGTAAVPETAGFARFTLDDIAPGPETPMSTTAPVNSDPVHLDPTGQDCLDSACELRFNLPPPPDGLSPTGTLVVTSTPFSIRIEVEGIGDPEQWVAPNAPDAELGAAAFVAGISVSDDNPIGSIVCAFDDDGVCEGDTISTLAPSYNRISILALADPDDFPTPAEGVARLVMTMAFQPALQVVDPPRE